MIKGVEKKIIVVNNTESEQFEQAVFILKNANNIPQKNVVKECERMMYLHTHVNDWHEKEKIWKRRCIVAMVSSILFFSLMLIVAFN